MYCIQVDIGVFVYQQIKDINIVRFYCKMEWWFVEFVCQVNSLWIF